jgi:hypothetical protein
MECEMWDVQLNRFLIINGKNNLEATPIGVQYL